MGVQVEIECMYLGNKQRLVDWIRPYLLEGVLYDAFGGSCAISRDQKPHRMIIINDIEPYSNVYAYCYISNSTLFWDVDIPQLLSDGLPNIIQALNSLRPIKGFFYNNYSYTSGRMFFRDENAGKIDAIRDQISQWCLPKREECVLLTSLMDAMDRCANTMGMYTGVYCKDTRGDKPLKLKPPNIIDSKYNNMICCENTLDMNVSCDVAYFDPPYTRKQYSDVYHILNTVCMNDKPTLSGKIGFRPNRYKSPFSKKSECEQAFKKIFDVNAKRIVVSYSTDGLLSPSIIKSLLERRGRTTVISHEYPKYEINGVKSTRLKEILFICDVV